MKNIDIYIDLECRGRFNDCEGRYSIVLEISINDTPYTREHFGGFKDTTNNRVAILACIEALKKVVEPCNIKIHINSPYMARTNTQLKTWLQQSLDKRKNGDLLRKYADLIEQHEVEVIHERTNTYTGAMDIQRANAKYELVIKAKEEGMTITGKMRDYIASAMGVSTGKMGQIEKINHSLCDEGKEALRKGDMTFDKAYNTARLPEQEQKAVVEDKKLLSKDVKAIVDSKYQESEQERQEQEEEIESSNISEEEEKTCEGDCFFCEIDQCNSKQEKRNYCMYDSEKRCSIYGARKVAIETLRIKCESTCCMSCNLECGARCNYSQHCKVSESDTEEVKEVVHEIKIANCYFEDVKNGIKQFELRKNDRNYKVGNKLKMMEYKDGEYTGRAINAVVTFMLEDYEGIKEGYCILSIKLI